MSDQGEAALERIRAAAANGSEELDLSELGLTELPDELWELKQLTSLNLSRNQLTGVPDAISRLTSLTILNLSRNQLTEVPEAIFGLTNLTRLDLSENQLTGVPEAIFGLTNLTRLDLSGNQFTGVSEAIFGLTNLTMLVLSGNQLTRVPEAISRLANLTELALSGNQLTRVPEAIFRLANLAKLYLSGNQLREVPEAISRLTNLNELYLSWNQLTDVPEAISRLTNLATLDLRGNPLDIPQEILEHVAEPQVLFRYLAETRGAAPSPDPEPKPPPAPAILRFTFAGFNNDNARAREDRLGINQDVNALASVLAAKDVDPPLSIGLFGDWGSGKTFFMDLLERRIEELAKASTAAGIRKVPSAYCSEIIQIRFNAWHYVDANLWASLVTHIFDELNAKLNAKPAKVDAIKLVQELQSTKDQIAEVDARQSAITARIEALNGDLAAAATRRTTAELGLKDLQKTVLASVSEDAGVKKALRGLEKDLGLDTGKLAVGKLDAERAAVRTWTGRIARLLRSNPSPMKVLLVVLVVVLTIGIPIVMLILHNEVNLASWKALVASAGAIVTGLLPTLITIHQYGERVITRIEATLEAADAVERDKRATPSSTEIALEQKVAVEKAEEESLGREKRDFERQKAEVERRIEELRQGTSFKRYVLERNADDNYRKQLGLVAMIHRDFKVLSERLLDARDEPHVERIVLYVDDLDRCPADQVVAVLQAVHLMLSFRLFVVVVGVDSRWLLHSLEEHYAAQLSSPRHGATPGHKDTTLANTPHNYLEKIFQIPFTMSPMKKDGFGSLIDSLVSPPVKPIVAPNPAPAVEAIDAPAPAPAVKAILAPVSTPLARDNGAVAKFEPRPASPPDKVPVARGAAVEPPSAVDQPGSGIDDDELAPANLMISAEEIAFMKDNLDSTIGSPRAAKRFLNIYRILRASPGGGHEWRDDVSRHRYYRLLQIFLSVIIGHPICAGQLFQDILATNGLNDSKALLTYLEERADKGRAQEDDYWDELRDMFKKHEGDLTDWPEVLSAVLSTARFSFHTGRALAAARRSAASR
jgi:hypothetical protein